MDAELHFVSGDRNTSLPLSTPRGSQKTTCASAIEFESAEASPVPTLDHDLIATDDHALVVAGMAFHISECENTNRRSSRAKGRTSHAPLNANPTEIATTTSAREAKTRTLLP